MLFPNLHPLLLRLIKGSSFNLPLSSDVFKSAISLMLPSSFWDAPVHPLLERFRWEKVKKQNWTESYYLVAKRILFNTVDTVQSPTYRHLVSFEMSYRSPQLTDAALQGYSPPIAVYSPVPNRCLRYQKQQKKHHVQATQWTSTWLLAELDKKKKILQDTN